jgi:nondiscriminating glutamyl-tRNA synthetase
MTVRVRFAPSPTGHLHVGGARTAIFNWLFARRHGGTFIIRVEDTDQARSTRESEQMVLDDLRWLGLDWEEGPDVGGPHAPYRQSERVDIYSRAAQQLLGSGHAYRCFCSEETLEAKRKEAEAEGRPPHYDLTCWGLSAQEVSAKLSSWTPSAWRFHVPKEEGAAFDGDVTIHDLIRGEVTWRKESLGDFILVRSDGLPTYNFSVVIDDHEMEITHVIRAEEHLTNTHRQVLIYRALGWAVPEFAHVSLILGQDRTKLSKRHGATSVSAYANEGYVPAAMVNYLTLLGWSSPDGAEVFTAAEAIAKFALDRVNAAPAVFDPQKLDWVNSQYIHAATAEALVPQVEPFIANWVPAVTDANRAWLQDAIELVKKSATRLTDFAPALQLFFEYDTARASELLAGTAGAPIPPEALQLVRALEADLAEHGAPLDEASYKAMTERLKNASGQKGKALFMPLRIALTGSEHGPELVRALPLLQRGSATSDIAPVQAPLARVRALLGVIGG